MNTTRDYYEILGIPKGSNVDEVKKAYRQLVMKNHPDRVSEDKKKEAEEKFKEISEAYAVLSDDKKKQLYDQYGHAGIDSKFSTEDIFRGADFSSIFGQGGGFGDIFEQFFSDGRSGRGSRGARRQVGEDIQMKIEITLEEACFGVEKDVSLMRYDNCSSCNGSGAASGSSKVTCQTCQGQGAVRSGLGFISFSQTCPNCNGEGKIIKNRCKQCSGQGRVKGKKKLKVTIPKGVDNGSVLRLKEEGHFAGDGRGDFYLYTAISPHNIFIREGDNIKFKVKVPLTKAILGSEIDVLTLHGVVRMKVPVGTQPNSVFRLKGKGITNLRTKHLGDEFVEIEIAIPTNLSKKEQKLIKELADLRKEN